MKIVFAFVLLVSSLICDIEGDFQSHLLRPLVQRRMPGYRGARIGAPVVENEMEKPEFHSSLRSTLWLLDFKNGPKLTQIGPPPGIKIDSVARTNSTKQDLIFYGVATMIPGSRSATSSKGEKVPFKATPLYHVQTPYYYSATTSTTTCLKASRPGEPISFIITGICARYHCTLTYVGTMKKIIALPEECPTYDKPCPVSSVKRKKKYPKCCPSNCGGGKNNKRKDKHKEKAPSLEPAEPEPTEPEPT